MSELQSPERFVVYDPQRNKLMICWCYYFAGERVLEGDNNWRRYMGENHQYLKSLELVGSFD